MSFRTVLIVLVVGFGLRCPATDLRIFTVGNSLSDWLGLEFNPPPYSRRDMLQQLVASSESNTIAQLTKCNTAGAALFWLWNDPSNQGSFSHEPLHTNGVWDVLILQPYPNGGTLYDNRRPRGYDQGDVVNAKNFINKGLTNSPNLQVYIYSHWPEIPNYKRHNQYTNNVNPETGVKYTWEEVDVIRAQALTDFEAAGGWDTHWDALYTDPYSSANTRTRDYFEQIVNILNTDRFTPGDPISNLQKEVLMIPAGDVMYEINQRMKTNPSLFPRASGGSYTNILQMHADVPHLRGGVGIFIAAATWYSVLYGESPDGLDYTVYNDDRPESNQYFNDSDPYYEEILPLFAKSVCDAVWDVVSMHPYAGIVDKDTDADGIPDWWEQKYFGGITNAVSTGLVANARNTAKEAYLSGVVPTNAASSFRLSGQGDRLTWDAEYGRTYNVYWSSNLFSPFELIQSNVTQGVFTNTSEGFYRIDVRLAP